MRIVCDRNVSRSTASALRGAGHDVVESVDWPPDPGDAEILASALREPRCVLTQDADFGELAVRFGLTHVGVIRFRGLRAIELLGAAVDVCSRFGDEIERGAIVVVSGEQIRVRI